MEPEKFNRSFFIQPDLFIRIRPGNEKDVIIKLEAAEIRFRSITSSCISLPNSSKIERVIDLDREAVVQDRSSQQVAGFLPWSEHSSVNNRLSVWDCCAASGGKSIMAKDVLGNIDLTVSDIRESVLVNLRKRFFDAGIRRYKNFVIDLTNTQSLLTIPHSPFDLIIADVPCTGSGTWGRTPEQLFYFEEKKIAEYADRQKNIVLNVMPALKPGGWFLYITCSVFKKENEAIIEFVKEKYMMQVVKMELIKGYDKKADTMFAALLQKPL
jgi:16S rRNA (cytosine967-C5)-methyltransferase